MEEFKTIELKDFKYIFIELGGGWEYVHELYGVTPTGELYATKEFNERELELSTTITCEYICKFDEIELGIPSVKTNGIMDATDLFVLEVSDELKEVYQCICWPDNNPTLFNQITKVVYEKKLESMVKIDM